MKKILLIVAVMLSSLSSYATIYLVETGNSADCTWRIADVGEVNVNLKNAGKTLQQYINGQALAGGDQVWIAGGTYIVGATINPCANGSYYGGFSGKELTPADRSKVDLDGNGFIEPWEFKNLSIIDGNGGSFQCIVVNNRPNISVDGWVIQNIKLTGSQSSAYRVTGTSSNNKISNCIIRNNQTTNTTTIYSVTLSLESPNGILESSLIENNKSDGTAGAAYGAGANIENNSIIRSCVIRGNVNHVGHLTNSKGAGLFLQGTAKAQNCLIYNNESPNANGNGAGAGIYMGAAGVTVEYCTVVNNKGYSGIHAFAAASIKNSIVMDNYKIDGATLSNFTISGNGSFTGEGIATQTAIPAWATGNNYLVNATTAELFNNPTSSAGIANISSADWTLKSTATAPFQIGAKISDGDTDFVGNIRPTANTCLGAYEPIYYNGAELTLLYWPAAMPTYVNYTNLTSINAKDASSIPADATLPIDLNPNCLIYAPIGTTAAWDNLVIGNSATKITLADAKAFDCATAINTTSVTYSRDCYTDGGWETIILPFDVTSITTEATGLNGELVFEAFSKRNEANTSVTFVPVEKTALKANTPYLIKYNGTAQATGTKATFVFNGSGNIQTAINTTDFIGTYTKLNGVTDAKGYAPYGDGTVFGKIGEKTTVNPFRAYLSTPVGPNPAPVRYSVIHDGGATNIDSDTSSNSIYATDGAIIIHTDNTQIFNIYTIDGRRVHSEVVENYAVINGLPQGIYIVNNQKVVIK